MTARLLRADEIEIKADNVEDGRCNLLLYKDARVDMKLLDEMYGVTGWKRSHQIIGGMMFCQVSVWDKEKKQWIEKSDVGTSNNNQLEKSASSDSFKRACVNFGIGRELYTAPTIWVDLCPDEYEKVNGMYKVKKGVYFTVAYIEYDADRHIVGLEIKDNKGNLRYVMENLDKPGERVTQYICTEPSEQVVSRPANYGMPVSIVERVDVNTNVINPFNKEQAYAYTLCFGKHKGKTLGEIQNLDAGYTKWLLNNAKDTDVRKACELVLN